MPLWLWLV